ncbi:Tat (twin-arginine translocation) pathway signal sequence [Granulicella rosea]|uniref:Tat (Twin-arginine translocation) pathway signal sequence n=1 Tax=Granulicella rosea TaxID=474952 RepID=A0A239IZY5_9BACT|nr:alginate lyase family protein [Granulicella rosea]SNS97974.1 Tat (twin-arginine translocation) pathway signal sequence [Granulicella rosea]
MQPLTRRSFLTGIAATTGSLALRSPAQTGPTSKSAYNLVARVDRERIVAAARQYLKEKPITVTASHSPRSEGGPHDYFSEGDYWWPDPKNPAGPYIRRDGFSNPANFNDHREALIRLSVQAPTLAAAWRLTHDPRYLRHFALHLHAWFVDPATRMNPNLEYAQAITGVTRGRGIGVIDTLQLVDVVRALRVVDTLGGLPKDEIEPIRAWFAGYVDWMATSKNGKEEEEAKNNHGTCWVLQMAEFSQFARRPDMTTLCRERFKTLLVPGQIAADGSLPQELARTKPYSYSLFDADVFAGLCQSLSTSSEDLWQFKGPNGAGVATAIAFLYPAIADKAKWSYPRDVEYFDDFPSRRPCLLFAGEAAHRPEYLATWQRLDASPTVLEVIRNLPIRQPLLWVDPVLSA